MPPKKERGKQRKAAKNLAAANGVGNISKTVALVRKGDHDATVLLGDGSLEESNGISYEQSGVLSTVLKFLKRCEDDTFVKVMLDVGGGNLKMPASWVCILLKAEVQEPNCRLQIAQNIGPLVRCMCNDTKRQFFKSNKHWADIIQGFAALIHNMIFKGVNKDETKGRKIIDTLLQYEGLLTSIVQWGFWKEEHRPDIAKELTTDDRVNIVRLGMSTVNRLIKAVDTQTEEGRERLETIGKTPIISKEYDPECTISLVVGLIRQTKIKGWSIDTYTCLYHLISNVSCVDKDVITELIGLGIKTSDDKWIAHVAVLLRYMILKRLNNNENFYSNDARVAFAIRGGLVELCLHFIERFGLNGSFDKKKDDDISSLFFSIKMILANISWTWLHKKTAKAVNSKRHMIDEELQRLEQNADITINVNCKKLLEMTRSILDINGSYCCRCNKSLSRTEVKLCNGCNRMSYCSRACQREDWLDGHNANCCKMYTTGTVGQFQGRVVPNLPENERAAQKIRGIEINMSMIQLKLFLDHSETIIGQVKDLDIPIYDCIARFDFRDCLLVAEVRKYTEELEGSVMRGFEKSRSMKNITCIFISYMFDGSLDDEGKIPTLIMLRSFPHKWLVSK